MVTLTRTLIMTLMTHFSSFYFKVHAFFKWQFPFFTAHLKMVENLTFDMNLIMTLSLTLTLTAMGISIFHQC